MPSRFLQTSIISALRDHQPGVIVAGMNAIAPIPNNPITKPNEPRPITRKVTDAIQAMVWLGLPRKEAAEKAGMTEHGLYKALRSPPVKAAYLAECEVLRVSGRARRIHRLEAMVEQDDNKAAVINAALALDRITDESMTGRSSQSLPGLQIVIVQGSNQSSIDARLTHTTIDNAEMKAISE